jgi:RNA polymerase sigma factor (sigma-70 family)
MGRDEDRLRYLRMMGPADREVDKLVGQLSSGDAGAVPALLGRYLAELTEYVRRHTGVALAGRETPADLVQSVCRDVLEDAAGGGLQYRGEAQFRQWLFQAALHKIQTKGRYHAAQRRDPGREVAPADVSGPDLPMTWSTPSRVAATEEERQRLLAAMAQLDERDRRIVQWAHLEGLPHDVIAERLGITVTNSRVLLSRALARLARLVDPRD